MSLITELFNTLDKRSLGGIANALGESDQSVSRGMQASIGTVVGGLASRSQDSTFLRSLLDLAPSGMGDVSWSSLAGGLANHSPLISAGQRIISKLFGNSEGAITRALGSGTGLQPSSTSSLMAMAAPMVLGFLGRRVHDDGLSIGGLGSLLQREIPAVRAVVPAGVSDLLWPREHEVSAASPVVAQTVARERSSASWLIPLIMLALIPGLIWLLNRAHRPTVVAVIPARPPITGTANRVIPEVPRPTMPGNVDLYFETGSAKLKPDSQARLNQFVNALTTNRDARVRVDGFTDNVGNATSNQRLSEARAKSVKAELVRMGVPADRLTAQGFGQDNPIADNATAAGRQMNRRVSVGVEGL